MREKPIEQHLRDLVEEAGGRCYKWVSPGNSGVPDDIVLFPGMCFFVELKSSTGKLAPIQKIQHRILADLGFDVVVLNSKEKVDEWVAMQRSALGK